MLPFTAGVLVTMMAIDSFPTTHGVAASATPVLLPSTAVFEAEERIGGLSNGADKLKEEGMTLFIPTYEGDLCQLPLLVSSLAKQDAGAKQFPHAIVGWTSYKPLADHRAELDDILKPLTQDGRTLQVIEFVKSPLYGSGKRTWFNDEETSSDSELTEAGGWKWQMMAKLDVARMINTTHYVAFDSKNVAMRPIKRSTFFRADGTERLASMKTQLAKNPHLGWFASSAHILNATSLPGDLIVPLSVTPTMMRTRLVRGLVAKLRAEQGSLVRALRHQQGAQFDFEEGHPSRKCRNS